MLGFSTYAALLPELRDAWGLSNSQAGIIGGMFFAGYAGTVSFWTALTDRTDPRNVYLAGSLIAVIGGAGFGFAAEGFLTATLFQVLLGVGIAATSLPGPLLLSHRIPRPYQTRYSSFYTSFFGIGIALSLAIAGFLAPVRGWRAAFLISAIGPAVSGFWVFLAIRRTQQQKRTPFSLAVLFPVAAWRKVLASRACAGYTFGYTVHCLELFGSRAWVVGFLVFSSQSGLFPWNLAGIAAVVN